MARSFNAREFMPSLALILHGRGTSMARLPPIPDDLRRALVRDISIATGIALAVLIFGGCVICWIGG
jgi:hypothetical protein